MNASPESHPPAEVLKAYGLGKLDDAQVQTVMNHVDTCADCLEKVARLSGDSFVKRMRKAQTPSGTPAPGKSLSDLARSVPPTGSLPAGASGDNSVAPELAGNGQYDILRKLGGGGMGVVYLARHLISGREEVLKVMNQEYLRRSGSKERFTREIQTAASLRHANIVQMYTALELCGQLVLVMEYVPGKDLDTVAKEHGRLPVVKACDYIRQAAQGLQHAHEKGLVHRDIKPQNLMLAPEGKNEVVRILDFGLAKARSEQAIDGGLTGEGAMLGTPHYVAPEQSRDAAKASIQADIYSLGCTLYFLLVGAPPFGGKSLYEILEAHHRKEARPVNLLRPDVPEELASVIRKMTAKDPSKRYQTPEQVAEALNIFLKPGIQGTSAEPSSRSLSMGPTPAPIPARKKLPEKKGERSMRSPAPPKGKGVPRAPVNAFAELNVQGPMPQQDSRNPQESREEATKPKPRAGMVRQRRKVIPRLAMKFRLGALGCSVALASLLIAVGLIIFKVKTKDGVIVLENVPPEAELVVDGNAVTLKTSDGRPVEISVTPEKSHQLQVKQPGFKVFSKELAIEVGEHRLVSVRLEPLPSNGTPPSALRSPDEPGFVSLFNGKDLTGWTVDGGDAKHWTVEDGVIVGRSSNFGHRSYLLTDKEYADFVLHFEFEVEKESHGGVGLRAIPGERVPINNTTILEHPFIKLTDQDQDPTKATGVSHWIKDGCTNTVPTVPILTPISAWQAVEVTVLGDSCTAGFSGKPVVDLKLDPDAKNYHGIVPALKRVSGKVGFEIGKGTLRLRRIEIKETCKHAPGQEGRAGPDELVNSLGMKLAHIPAGKFWMGSADDDKEADDNEKPRHEVEITKGLCMGKYPVTVEQFRAFIADAAYQVQAQPCGGFDKEQRRLLFDKRLSWRDPGFEQGDKHPVVNVSWNDAEAFCAWLSRKEGREYRLPSEAEWEYCCRAGTTTRFYSGDADESLEGVANIADRSLKAIWNYEGWGKEDLTRAITEWFDRVSWDDGYAFTSPVGRFRPNRFGLYDMHGNVKQWCADWYDKEYYKNSPRENPPGPSAGSERVMRGSPFVSLPVGCRCAKREGRTPSYGFCPIGFRVVLSAAGNTPAEGVRGLVTGDGGFVPLFDGKGLTGWTRTNSSPIDWVIHEQALIGLNHGGPGTGGTLVTERTDYANFHLRCESMLSEGLPSAINFRFSGQLIQGARTCYAVTIAGTNQPGPEERPRITGSLLVLYHTVGSDPVAVARDLHLKAGEWFGLDLIAQGSHFRVSINGIPVADYQDAGNSLTAGSIGVTCRPGSKVCFRRMEIKELPAASPVVRRAKPPGDAGLGKKTYQTYSYQPDDWKMVGEEIRQTNNGLGHRVLLFGDSRWTDYDLTVSVKSAGSRGIVYRADRVPEQGVLAMFNADNSRSCVELLGFGPWRRAADAPGQVEADRWYKMTVKARGPSCDCFVDDKLLLNYQDPLRIKGAVGLRTWSGASAFRDIKVVAPDGKVLFEGMPIMPPRPLNEMTD